MATSKQAAATKSAAKQPTTAKKTTAKPAATKPASATKTTAAKQAPAKKAPAKKAPAKNEPSTKAATPAPTGTAPAGSAKTAKSSKAPAKLAVREDESPWTAAELAEVRAELISMIDRMTAELNEMEQDLVGLIRDSGDGAGDDQADAGTKNFATDYEYTVAQKARESLLQSQHALERIDDGTYGTCESCGKPIGKLRLQAFPRATLCMQCKQLQERR